MYPLDARMLGPLEIRVDGQTRRIPGNNARKVLAILLYEADRFVQVSGLVQGVWDGDEPADPVRQIRNRVSDLRAALGPAKDRIELAESGDAYRFRIGENELDVLRCKAAERRAAALREAGRPGEAADELRAALDEFRGPALAGLPGRMIGSIARDLDELRPPILEQRFDVELELGGHAELLGELRQTVHKHPSRQRFAAQYMRALHAAGRTGEALEFFEAVKERQAESLGFDPDRELRAIHARILQDDDESAPTPAEVPPTPPPVPSAAAPDTLPPSSARFTGRHEQLRRLDRVLEASDGLAGLAVVSGMGGVGKTALAVHWARTVADRFPDGRLYFDLRGFDPVAPETGPGPALGKALRRLGVDRGSVPADLDDQADLFRTLMAGRRVLVVLDNARDAQQVRPLLTGAPGSFTIVTSRNRLSGLVGSGGTAVPLRTLDESESTAVLGRFLDGDLTESRAARRIIAVCSGLPLALCLVGAWAAANPDLPLSSLADRLESTGNVLRVLSSDDPNFDPRTVFSCSYQELGSRARKAFRLLGLHPGPDITAAAMASLAKTEPREAETALRELATVQLVHERKPGRFATHDLLRAFAVERLSAEVGEEDREAATGRMLEHYLFTAASSEAALSSIWNRMALGEIAEGVSIESLAGMRSVAAWFAEEHQVLLGLAQLRVSPRLDMRIWQLAWCFSEYLVTQTRERDIVATQSAALAAVRRAGHEFGEVVSLAYMARALLFLGDEDAAHGRLDRALELADEHGLVWAKGFVYYSMMLCFGRADRHDEARDQGLRALECFRDVVDRFWEWRTLYGVGRHAARLGELGEARAYLQQMVEASRGTGLEAVGEAFNAVGLGFIAQCEGRFDVAIKRYEWAAAVFVEQGIELSAAYAGELTGDALDAAGDRVAAVAAWRSARRSYAEIGAVFETERVRRKLADAGAL